MIMMIVAGVMFQKNVDNSVRITSTKQQDFGRTTALSVCHGSATDEMLRRQNSTATPSNRGGGGAGTAEDRRKLPVTHRQR